MIWPLLAASAGAVGMNYQASKELEIPSKGVRNQAFWAVFALGAFTGVWVGVTFAPQISSIFGFADTFFATPKTAISTSDDETSSDEEEYESRRKKRKSRSKQ